MPSSPSEEAGGPAHPDFSKGFNGGMMPGFWRRLDDIWYFLEDYGWPILISVVVLMIAWPHIEDHVRRVLYNLTSPPPVHADRAAVERARQRQQRELMEASRARRAAEEAKRREAILAAKEGNVTKGSGGSGGGSDKPSSTTTTKRKVKPSTGDGLNFMGRGGDSGGSTYWGGGGGGGGGYRPSRRRPPGGGG
eukprot:m.173552 g.173552  ORF g.173552 m.173552 type:complete len:193 (-) comp13710_c0_seq1:326-904(-)